MNTTGSTVCQYPVEDAKDAATFSTSRESGHESYVRSFGNSFKAMFMVAILGVNPLVAASALKCLARDSQVPVSEP